MTNAEARALLLSLFPPGCDRWADISPGPDKNDPATGASDLWLLVDGAAQGLAERVFSPLEDVAADADPMTLTSVGIAAWEQVLALDHTRVALAGSQDQRHAQILARLSEWGLPTDANIQAALFPFVGQTTVVQITRSDLTSQDTYTNAGPGTIPGSGTLSMTLPVYDNGSVSSAGVWVTFTVTHPHVEDLGIALVNHSDSDNKIAGTWTSDTGSVTGRTYKVKWAAADAGDAFFGVSMRAPWSFRVINTDGSTGTVTDVSIFVEGIGRETGGAEGYGSAIFEVAFLFDPATAPAGYDLGAARMTLARFTPAHVKAYLALKMSDGTICAIVDDADAVCDSCLCC